MVQSTLPPRYVMLNNNRQLRCMTAGGAAWGVCAQCACLSSLRPPADIYHCKQLADEVAVAPCAEHQQHWMRRTPAVTCFRPEPKFWLCCRQRGRRVMTAMIGGS